MGIDYQYAKKIVKKYNEFGAEAVRNQRKTPKNHRRGKHPLLNDKQLQKLIKALKESPSDAGIWTGLGLQWEQDKDATVQHRYEWLYIYGFVEPKTGKTYWYLIPRVNTKWLNLVRETFAAEAGASPQKILLLVQDRAGWHTSSHLELPTAIVIELLPPDSAELQPAER